MIITDEIFIFGKKFLLANLVDGSQGLYATSLLVAGHYAFITN